VITKLTLSSLKQLRKVWWEKQQSISFIGHYFATIENCLLTTVRRRSWFMMVFEESDGKLLLAVNCLASVSSKKRKRKKTRTDMYSLEVRKLNIMMRDIGYNGKFETIDRILINKSILDQQEREKCRSCQSTLDMVCSEEIT
jgi:hypothetical protein